MTRAVAFIFHHRPPVLAGDQHLQYPDSREVVIRCQRVQLLAAPIEHLETDRVALAPPPRRALHVARMMKSLRFCHKTKFNTNNPARTSGIAEGEFLSKFSLAWCKPGTPVPILNTTTQP